jgi:hypothetical protein
MPLEFEIHPHSNIFPLHETITIHIYSNSDYYTNSYIIQLLVTHSYLSLKANINTCSRSILLLIMLNYNIIIEEFVLVIYTQRKKLSTPMFFLK